MVKFMCPRCGYTTNYRGTFIRHLKRKKSCKTILSNQSIASIIDGYNLKEFIEKYKFREKIKYDKKTKKMSENHEKKGVKIAQHDKPFDKPMISRVQFYDKPFDKPMISRVQKRTYFCKFCKKGFKHYQSSWKHEKKCQKLALVVKDDKIENLENQIKMLKKEMIDIKASTGSKIIGNNNVITTNQQNNIVNQQTNIVINNFGSEDMSYITGDDIKSLLMAGPYSSIPKLVNRIHFNKDHPENHNLAITNKKSKWGSIRKNNKWQMILIKDMLDKIIATKFEYIDETYKEIKKEIPKHKKKCYEKYQEELDFNEEQRRQLEDSLYIAIMNCTKMLGLKVK